MAEPGHDCCVSSRLDGQRAAVPFDFNDACALASQRPRFGQLASEIANISRDDLEDCLLAQRQQGGRLGEIFVRRGFLDRQQVSKVLVLQACWVAETLHDRCEMKLPRDTFLSLAMPAFNEGGNIDDTLAAASAILPVFVTRHEIIVVDDGSKDDTAQRVAAFSEHDPTVRLVRHEHNRGYGAAVASGLRAAEGQLIAFLDSDGQFSLLDLPQLLLRLPGHEAVIGYRHRRADSPRRLLMAWAWNRALRLAFGVRVRDMDCAFKLFRSDVVDRLNLSLTSPGINPEILIQCLRRGWKVRETPVMHYPRYHGVAAGAGWRMIARAIREFPQLGRCRFSRMGAGPAAAALASGSHAQKVTHADEGERIVQGATDNVSVMTLAD